MSELNDPRVLFAAERTLLAWNRTSLSLMAFGFVIERFGLFMQILGKDEVKVFQRHVSFFIGITFLVLGVVVACYSIVQHRRVLRTLRPVEIPMGYDVYAVVVMNGVVAFMGLALALYVFRGFV